MTTAQKQQIQQHLLNYVSKFDSQAKAVATLKGVSEATVISIKKGTWDSISADMWRNVGKQVGWDSRQSKLVETMAFDTMILYFGLAKDHGATFAITGGAGYGKTFASKWYRDNMQGKNVYYLECASYWNKKYFLMELLNAMGKPVMGMNIYEMMKTIVAELRKQDKPLIILDEVDKLPDMVLQFFITFYNELNGLCGIVWTSTDAIKKRINNGLRRQLPGYNEIYRRIGRKFIDLVKTDFEEVRAICEANNITDAEEVHRLFNEYEGDISRIDRAYLRQLAKQMYKKRA